jgi:hypothetical protein
MKILHYLHPIHHLLPHRCRPLTWIGKRQNPFTGQHHILGDLLKPTQEWPPTPQHIPHFVNPVPKSPLNTLISTPVAFAPPHHLVRAQL